MPELPQAVPKSDDDPSGNTVKGERLAAVDRARREWISRLIDLSRRNRLLFFRDLKTGTLDLTKAGASLIPALFRAEPIRIADLLPEEEQRAGVARLLEIYRKAMENLEERGLDTMYVAIGMATWASSDGGRPPSAPVLLCPITVEIRGREPRSSSIRRAGDIEVNPVLLHSLSVDHGVGLPADEVAELVDEDGKDPDSDMRAALSKIGASAKDVPGFAIEDRLVVGNFSFQKMAMVRDLEEYGSEIAAHDLIAALAGDSEARNAIADSRCELDQRTLDQAPIRNEHLILDADSSQQAVVANVFSGQDGVIQGPPGTGKSQSIANAIGALVAEGKRVLFVAEKRAALDVVAKRLGGCELGHLYLDLHGADIRRSQVASRIAECLAAVRESPPINTEELDQRLEERRNRLNGHVRRMHSAQAPSQKSVFQLQGELLRLPARVSMSSRWSGEALNRIDPKAAARARDLLLEASATPGLFLRTDPSPWTGARIRDERELHDALALSDRLSSGRWPAFGAALSDLLAEAGFVSPESLSAAKEMIGVVAEASRLQESYTEKLFSLDLDTLTRALAPLSKGKAVTILAWCTDARLRSALHELRSLRKSGPQAWTGYLKDGLSALRVSRLWQSSSSDTRALPRAVTAVAKASQHISLLLPELNQLSEIIVAGPFADMPLEKLGALLDSLKADRRTPYLLPDLYRIEGELQSLGVDELVRELRDQRPAPTLWPDCLTFAWLSSCLETARGSDPTLASFNGRLHDQFVQEFGELDVNRLETASLRIRRLHAMRAVTSMNEHRDQEALVRREGQKKTRHLPVRRLLAEAPDVLLSLFPCWMASPLSVSHLLDGKQKYFDVVLFDEASQVPPEDAIPSILRASRAVVAGDRHQLPPTTFFDVDIDESDLDSAEPTVGFESVLDIMSAFLESWNLDWHYRSRDERLIAFSNRWIYGNRLITFPSAGADRVISHVPIPSDHEPDPDSCSSEVRRVVDLVLSHAKERPEESLGVITMGVKHARRIEAEMYQLQEAHPELDDFFNRSREEPFFVKNLERVQGDERDAIILSVGYGKDSSGRLLNRFGPLNFEGGQRRLNVAVTRARQRLTVVSSFAHSDMDPARFSAEGVKLLRDYLEYAGSGGRILRASGATGTELNPFEADVFETLTANGMKLIPQWGTSRYRIDMVVQHPDEPGRFVLAIECDGASYHSAYTARDRDRLRQQQLEALGWRFCRIWSTDWFLRKAEEVHRVQEVYRAALIAQRDGSAPVGHRAEMASLIRPSARGPRPRVLQRGSITDYRLNELVALVRWIESDGLALTDEEIVTEMVRELGFSRRGSRIESAVRMAIQSARAAVRS